MKKIKNGARVGFDYKYVDTSDAKFVPASLALQRIKELPAMGVQSFLQFVKADADKEKKNATRKAEYNSRTHKTYNTYIMNTICTFDTETTKSVKAEAEFMYIWQFCLNGYVCIGRTWDEFLYLMQELKHLYGLNASQNLIVWVHNLGYDSTLIMPLVGITKVFATDRHSPVYFNTTYGITFRDSYIYSGYSLEKTVEQNTIIPVKKLVGDLDYNKERTSKTPLTDTELGYCINDVTSLFGYIYEEAQRYKNVSDMPLTNTGKVREYIRDKCLYKNVNGKRETNKKYYDFIHSCNIDGLDEYNVLKCAFSGGYTHASHIHSDMTMREVKSMDFASSYPATMLEYKFPCSSGEKIYINSKEDYDCFLRDRKAGYWHIIALELWGVDDKKFPYEHYISASKCTNYMSDKEERKGFTIDNGRVVSSKHIRIICTDEDLDTITETYNIKKMKIHYVYRYKVDYLPLPFIKSILKFYGDKTKLKGIESKKAEYQHGKGMLNSIYGMMVQSPLSADIGYDAETDEYTVIGENDSEEEKHEDAERKIEKYNKSKKRFTFFPVGVAITSRARRNLWKYGIEPLGIDYIYSDTDSVKYLNADAHEKQFDDANKELTKMIKETLNHYGISYSEAEPETVKGKKKPLGVWEFDGKYRRFKTLGAKRYLTEDDDGAIIMTVAGVNKKTGTKYITSMGRDPFDIFDFGMVIPAEYSGKTVIKYGAGDVYAEITDEDGRKEVMHESARLYLYNAEYKLMSPQEYMEYLRSHIYDEMLCMTNYDMRKKLQEFVE